jgi:hypothetical protein
VAFGAGSFLLALGLRDRERPDPHEDERPRGFTAALRQRDLLPLWWMGAVFATVLACNFGFLNVFVRDTGLGSVGGFFTAYSGGCPIAPGPNACCTHRCWRWPRASRFSPGPIPRAT